MNWQPEYHQQHLRALTRRQFLGRSATGIGAVALASLLNPRLFAAGKRSEAKTGGLPGLPHFAPKAKSLIYLHMNGGPSQIDLWDYKPGLAEYFDKDLPESVRKLILNKAEGNPFFVEEVIRTLIDSEYIVQENNHWRATREIVNVSIPDTLTGVLSARIDRLPENTKHVAQTAAVLGRIFAQRALMATCAAAPPPEQIEDVEPHLGVLTYEELVRRSQQDPEWFWDAVVEDLGIGFFKPYERVLDTSRGVPWATWFAGGTINLAHVTCDVWAERTPDAVAVLWEGEDGSVRRVTYRELRETADRLAGGLRSLGVDRGDAVGIFLPMAPETVAATLACAKLGAVYLPIFSGYAADAVATRLRDARAKALITADGFLRRGQEVRMSDIAKAAGVSRQAVYLHFNSRTELMVATTHYIDQVRGLEERLQRYRSATDGVEILDEFVEFWGNYIREIYGIAKALLAVRETDEAARTDRREEHRPRR